MRTPLPFIHEDGDEIDYWRVTPSGDADADFSLGSAYAICYALANQDTVAYRLGFIVAAMTRDAPPLDRIAVGFLDMTDRLNALVRVPQLRGLAQGHPRFDVIAPFLPRGRGKPGVTVLSGEHRAAFERLRKDAT